MEESRLKPMAEGYDEKLFNRLYSEVMPLKRKLAGQIDHHRFGLTYEDILSFFDIKITYVFNKHYNEPPEKIKAYLLNAIRNFKCRILRAAYTKKYSQSIIGIDEAFDIKDDNDNNDTYQFYKDRLMEFMKDNLSSNALLILEIQLNPPPFILDKINTNKNKPLQKIPDQVILEYLDLGQSNNAYKYLNHLKKEIKQVINFAKSSLN